MTRKATTGAASRKLKVARTTLTRMRTGDLSKAAGAAVANSGRLCQVSGVYDKGDR